MVTKNLLLSSFDRVGTYNFVSVILNAAPLAALTAGELSWYPTAIISMVGHHFLLVIISAKTQLSDHLKVNDASQLINNISNQ